MSGAESKYSFEPIMQKGTSGQSDYIAIARRGKMVLSVKPAMLVDAKQYGYAGHTMFVATLRSSFASFPLDEGNVVVKLGPKPTLATAWSEEIEWEKNDDQRSSTTITSIVKGSPWGSVAEREQFIAEYGDKKLPKKMAQYLLKLVGDHADSLFHTEEQLVEYLDGAYGDAVKHAQVKQAEAEALKKLQEENVGMFTMQASLLKKIYADQKKTVPVPKITKGAAKPDAHAAEDLDGSEDDDAEE